MRKCLVLCLMATSGAAAYAADCKVYDARSGDCLDNCPVCDCAPPADVARGNYAGFRIYKNAHSSYSYNLSNGHRDKHLDDNFGFGTTLGNSLTDYLRVEYETLYMGSQYTTNAHDFEYDVWANMFNAYLLYDIDGAFAPYIGAGLGLTGIWGAIDGHVDSDMDLSYQGLAGLLFRLNSRIDIEVGFKYINYGRVKHTQGVSKVYATQIYIGGALKFGL